MNEGIYKIRYYNKNPITLASVENGIRYAEGTKLSVEKHAKAQVYVLNASEFRVERVAPPSRKIIKV